MASVKIKFRPSPRQEEEGMIYYQIIHAKKIRRLLSPYTILPSEWDERRSAIATFSHLPERRQRLLSIRDFIRRDLERLVTIERSMENKGFSYTVDDIVDEFNRFTNSYSLFNFMTDSIARLRTNGKIRTAETYTSTLNSFRKFRNGKDIMIDCLTSDIMEDYEAWLRKKGISPNTVSFYIRILRAVYNRAAEHDLIENRHPFRHVYTGIGKTVKRALPLAKIKEIKSLDLSNLKSLDFARDMFIMSFYLRGMSLIDMAFLRKEDLARGRISYRRRKTGQRLVIEWTEEMQHILDKYPENESPYLLPIIRKKKANERSTYRNVGYNINHALKKIADMVEITIPLTLYVARHSWASAARAKGIPMRVISEGMGHDSEATTQIYLASLDTDDVDRANSIIIHSL